MPPKRSRTPGSSRTSGRPRGRAPALPRLLNREIRLGDHPPHNGWTSDCRTNTGIVAGVLLAPPCQGTDERCRGGVAALSSPCASPVHLVRCSPDGGGGLVQP